MHAGGSKTQAPVTIAPRLNSHAVKCITSNLDQVLYLTLNVQPYNSRPTLYIFRKLRPKNLPLQQMLEHQCKTDVHMICLMFVSWSLFFPIKYHSIIFLPLSFIELLQNNLV